jgi:hypothetical protein
MLFLSRFATVALHIVLLASSSLCMFLIAAQLLLRMSALTVALAIVASRILLAADRHVNAVHLVALASVWLTVAFIVIGPDALALDRSASYCSLFSLRLWLTLSAVIWRSSDSMLWLDVVLHVALAVALSHC